MTTTYELTSFAVICFPAAASANPEFTYEMAGAEDSSSKSVTFEAFTSNNAMEAVIAEG
jgi:hypothetical protein